MMEKWSIALNFPSVPSFQYSYIPHVDGFVISVEAGKLFVRRPVAEVARLRPIFREEPKKKAAPG